MDRLEQCVKDISNNHYEYLMNLQNVNGVAYGYKYINDKNTLEPCINVLVENKINKKYLSKNNIVPKTYMGIDTDVIECGKIRLDNATNEDIRIGLDVKMRPLTGGCAIRLGINNPEKEERIIGSMCCIVQKTNNKNNKNEYYILGTNHVLTHNGKKPVGSVIIQPVEPLNGNMFIQTSNIVAMLDTFIPIKAFKNKGSLKHMNSVDCCIAKLINESLKSPFFLSYYEKQDNGEIEESYDIGKFKGATSAFLGMYIKQYGLGSGKGYGQVKMLHGTFTVDIDDKRAIFTKQIGINIEAKPGDSGAPVLSRKSDKIIGMHMGSSQNGFSMCNDINIILESLNVELYLGE